MFRVTLSFSLLKIFVPVENLSSVAEVQSSDELKHKESDIVWVEGAWPLLHVVTEVCILQVNCHAQFPTQKNFRDYLRTMTCTVYTYVVLSGKKHFSFQSHNNNVCKLCRIAYHIFKDESEIGGSMYDIM